MASARRPSAWQMVASHVGAMVGAGRMLRLKIKAHEFRQSQIIFETANEKVVVPFHKQGRLSMNTSSKIEERLRLRREPAVVQVLQVWWLAALRTELAACADVCGGGVYLHKETYVKLSRKLYKVMVEDWDEEDANAVAEDEWFKDAECGDGGERRMSRDLFCDAIFEFADVYTLGIGAAEYADFLWRLFRKIATGHDPSEYAWKDDANITHGLDDEQPPPAAKPTPKARGRDTSTGKPRSRLFETTASSRAHSRKRLASETTKGSADAPHVRARKTKGPATPGTDVAARDPASLRTSSLASSLRRRSSAGTPCETMNGPGVDCASIAVRSELRRRSLGVLELGRATAPHEAEGSEGCSPEMESSRSTPLVMRRSSGGQTSHPHNLTNGAAGWRKLRAIRKLLARGRVFPMAFDGGSGLRLRQSVAYEVRCNQGEGLETT